MFLIPNALIDAHCESTEVRNAAIGCDCREVLCRVCTGL